MKTIRRLCSEWRWQVASRLVLFLAVLAAVRLAVPAALADDIPFWGDETPATNRVCAAVASNTTASDFDSRLAAYVEFLLDNFTTTPTGLLFIFR